MADPVRSHWQSVLLAERSGLASLRHDLSSWLDVQDVPPAVADAVVLCVHEAAANAVEHAFEGSRAGSLVVDVERVGDDVTAEVGDDGTWKAAGPTPGRGLGLRLLASLMDDVDIRRTTTGTLVTMRLSHRPASSLS
jgi:serine/threonine-protein kinase RsbW